MNYSIKGRLSAAVCDRDTIAVNQTKVRFYRLADPDSAASFASARPKETFEIIKEKEIQKRKERLLGETKTDENGEFSFSLDGKKQDYAGAPVEVVLHYYSVPDFGQQDVRTAKNFEEFEVRLNVLQPKWRETEKGLEADWKFRISKRYWCFILRLLDIWVICGKLTDCQSGKPVSGIEVIAMDNDVITDDKLGSATTAGNGRFCIYYTSRDFKKTFLSPWINVETPIFPLGNGPDVYFKYAINGTVFEEESPSRGQKSDRENVGNCLCVNLCLNERDDDGEVPAHFFAIGQLRRYNSITEINPADGRTANKPTAAWNNQAFYGNMALVGALTEKLNGQPLEYKFQYAELSSPSDTIPTAPGDWTDVIPSEIANTEIGYGWKFSGGSFQFKDIAINANSSQIPVNVNGNWIVVPQSGSLPDSFNLVLNNNGPLIKLISSKIISSEVDISGLIPGASTTSVAALQQNRYLVLRMVKRQTGNAGSEQVSGISRPLAIFNTIYKNVPQKGSWLPGVSNELGVAALDLQELAIGGGCANINNSITANYTAANPNLGVVSLSMAGPGGPHNFAPLISSGQEAAGSSAYIGNVAGLANCAYKVVLSAELNLTNGESQHLGIWDEVLFCK